MGLGKPLKMITHPLRGDVPIYLGAEGPKNVAMAFEIADGWVPLYWSPYRTTRTPCPTTIPADFEIAVNVSVNVNDDVATALWPVKATLGFYIGGMGAKSKNFHTELMARMGFEEEAHFKIQDLFFAGKRDEAIMAVPDEFADEISLVRPEGAHRGAARGLAEDPGDDAARRRRRPRHHALPRRPHAIAGRRAADSATTTGPPRTGRDALALLDAQRLGGADPRRARAGRSRSRSPRAARPGRRARTTTTANGGT